MKQFVRTQYKPAELQDILPAVSSAMEQAMRDAEGQPMAFLVGQLVVKLHDRGYRIVKTGVEE